MSKPESDSSTGESSDESAETDRPEAYFWATDIDEIRRAFIIDVMSDADISGKILVENMQCVFEWLAGKPHALRSSNVKVESGKAPQRLKERPEGKE